MEKVTFGAYIDKEVAQRFKSFALLKSGSMHGLGRVTQEALIFFMEKNGVKNGHKPS